MLHLVPLTWMFIVTLMAAAEAMSGTLLGALVTWVFYGALPASLLAWLLGAPLRRRARNVAGQQSADPQSAEQQSGEQQFAEDQAVGQVSPHANGRDHAAGEALAPVREE